MAIGYSKEMQTGKKERPSCTKRQDKRLISSNSQPRAGESGGLLASFKKRKPINKVSKKQAGKIRTWSGIKIDRIEMMIDQFGCVLCEYCLKSLDESIAEGHHNDHDRNNNTPGNCRLVHPQCNTAIEDNNVKDVKSLLKESE